MVGANPSESSSRSSTRGFAIRARPMATACCSPPERWTVGSERRSSIQSKSSSTARTSQEPGRPDDCPTNRFSSTLSDGNSRRPSGTSAIPSRTRACGGSAVMSRPSSRIEPVVGWCRPMIERSNVDLPAPLAPMIARVSPGATARLTSVSACRYPCRTVRLRTSSIDVDSQVHLLDLRVGKNRLRVAFCDQATAGEADDAADGAGRRVHDMLHPDDGHRSLPYLLHDIDQLGDFRIREAAGDLIEPEDARLRRPPARELEAFALQQAEASGRTVRVLRQPRLLQDPGCDRVTLEAGKLPTAIGRDQQVLEDGHVLERTWDLVGPRDPHATPGCGVEPQDRAPIDAHVTRVGLQVAGDHREQRALPGTVRPDDPNRLSCLEAQRQAVGDRDPTEALADAGQLEKGRLRRHGLVGTRAPFTGTFLFALLSTTCMLYGNFDPFFHCTPTGFWIAIPGMGPFVKSSGPLIPV